MLRYSIMGALGAVLLGGVPHAVHAGPTSIAGATRMTGQETSAVEKAAYRRCWRRRGVRHCSGSRRAPRVYGYGDYYGRPRPEAFPTGSTSWWRAMDYEGRGGHGRGR